MSDHRGGRYSLGVRTVASLAAALLVALSTTSCGDDASGAGSGGAGAGATSSAGDAGGDGAGGAPSGSTVGTGSGRGGDDAASTGGGGTGGGGGPPRCAFEPEGEPERPASMTFGRAPAQSAVLPRDLATNVGTASFESAVESDGWRDVRVELLDGTTVRDTFSVPICGPAPHPIAFEVDIPAELTAFDVRVSLTAGEDEDEVRRVEDLVAGDVYLVNGQSNAAANPQTLGANENQGPFVRSFGVRTDDGAVTDADRVWRRADGDSGAGPASIGQWAIRMGAQLVATHGVPVAILNGGRGGKAIDFFLRDDADPASLATNYGRLLVRARNAGVDGAVRAILWWQGEADGEDFQAHRTGFHALHASFFQDYPAVERIYVTQIRWGDCGGYVIRTQETQRAFADELERVSVMASNGLDGHDGCHFTYEDGYREIGDRYAALLGRDLLGGDPDANVDAPNPISARFADAGDTIVVTMRDPDAVLTCEAGAADDFVIHAGGNSIVTSCEGSGNTLVLGVGGDASTATGINYLGHRGAGPWVVNELGVPMLSFWKVPIDPE